MEKQNTLIQTEKELQILIDRARQTDAVALDTEFVWERTYYPQLGLIQVALSDEDCCLIDPLVGLNLRPLGDLLSDRGVVKILHDAPQDLAILQRATDTAAQNVFDTRLAAGFADLSSTLSLGKLVKELLDIDLAKNETRTNWLQRPLSDEQVSYALDDVRYLRAVRILLLSRTIGPKIKSWLQEELNLLNNPASYGGPVDNNRYRKIRGCNHLDQLGLAVLRNLSTWREGMAQKVNRPRGHIISDSNLLDISRSRPKTVAELEEHGTLSAKAARKYGQTVTAIVTATLRQPEESYPQIQQQIRLSQSDKAALDKLHNLIALKGRLLGIDPALVGNSSELKLLVKTINSKRSTEPQQLRQTEGWRKSFLEDFFRQSRR